MFLFLLMVVGVIVAIVLKIAKVGQKKTTTTSTKTSPSPSPSSVGVCMQLSMLPKVSEQQLNDVACIVKVAWPFLSSEAQDLHTLLFIISCDVQHSLDNCSLASQWVTYLVMRGCLAFNDNGQQAMLSFILTPLVDNFCAHPAGEATAWLLS